MAMMMTRDRRKDRGNDLGFSLSLLKKSLLSARESDAAAAAAVLFFFFFFSLFVLLQTSIAQQHGGLSPVISCFLTPTSQEHLFFFHNFETLFLKTPTSHEHLFFFCNFKTSNREMPEVKKKKKKSVSSLSHTRKKGASRGELRIGLTSTESRTISP